MRLLDSWQNTIAPRFHWTAEAVTDLHAAIRDAGFEDKPLVQANVKNATTFFFKSPSGKGVTKKSGAGVPCLPSFLFLCPSLRLFLSLSLVALVAPPRSNSRLTLSLSLSCNRTSFAFSPLRLLCSCGGQDEDAASVEEKNTQGNAVIRHASWSQ